MRQLKTLSFLLRHWSVATLARIPFLQDFVGNQFTKMRDDDILPLLHIPSSQQCKWHGTYRKGDKKENSLSAPFQAPLRTLLLTMPDVEKKAFFCSALFLFREKRNSLSRVSVAGTSSKSSSEVGSLSKP